MTDDDKKLLRILSEAPLSDWVYHEEIKRDYFLHKSGIVVLWHPSGCLDYRVTSGKLMDDTLMNIFSPIDAESLFRSLRDRRNEALREAKEKLRQETVSAALEMLEG